jgi:uncharacterized protein YccT (UPF0319 family)
MGLKNGDIIKVDGVESALETSWCQGAHKVYKLQDQRLIFDLEKLIDNGEAQVIIVEPKNIIIFGSDTYDIESY